MTAGNQGSAWDKAKEDLKKDPSNKALQTAEATRREALNASLRKHGQKEVR